MYSHFSQGRTPPPCQKTTYFKVSIDSQSQVDELCEEIKVIQLKSRRWKGWVHPFPKFKKLVKKRPLDTIQTF